ncbi:hypothetical protein PAXINDRAFT_21935 [Paxillus involutus ATCC 200175]|uniref:Unplaced genomic scaffold PAXINscaffold_2205, whole genome shotgun sequence n=1 Tax=Paxillus involutus ATCC 200175 TaxID=664439 RepID=A0A0C9SLP2_PAXIN|nr:hypothetical protein PAXINDRAFT_21935 [Paxillus involutus ATCC 200175]
MNYRSIYTTLSSSPLLLFTFCLAQRCGFDLFRVAARGPGEGAMDQTADNEGLAAMLSSQDNDVQRARVEPQEPMSTRQTAIEEAADTMNLDMKDIRPTMPAGTSNGPQDKLNEINKEVEKGEGDRDVDEDVESEGERTNGGADKKVVAARGPGESATDQMTDDKDAAAPASSPDDDSGDVNVHHTYVTPTTTTPSPKPHNTTTPEHAARGGEVKPPQAKSRGHQDKVVVPEHDMAMHEHDKAVEGRKGVEGTTIKGEEAQVGEETQMVQARSMMVTDINEDGQHATNDTDNSPTTPPEPPPLHYPPSPDDPERRDDNNTTRSNKMPAQRHADAVHDPGNETQATPNIQTNNIDVETNGDHVEDDQEDLKLSRHPVGTMDGIKRCPNEPTEPPDEEEGERRGDGELRRAKDVKSKVETRVERSKESTRGQSEGNGGQRDGRMNDTGSTTSSVNCDSKQVKATPLAENEDDQQWNGRPNVTTDLPGPGRR